MIHSYHCHSFQLDTALPLCPEDEKLQMRKWVVTSILESEHGYLNILDILMQVSICLLFTSYSQLP